MSPVMVRAGGEPLFRFSWTPDPKATVRMDSCVLPSLDREVNHTLESFLPLECIIVIVRDREDDNRVNEYLSYNKGVYFYGCFLCMGIFKQIVMCLLKDGGTSQ